MVRRNGVPRRGDETGARHGQLKNNLDFYRKPDA